MTRTVLRSRSSDILSEVRLADRTGIVAASAPPTEEPEEITKPLTTLFAMAPPPVKPRRGKRTALFGCAAALFLVVGWIGGGMFGHDDPAPAVASAPLPAQTAPPSPPTTTQPSPPPASAVPVVVEKTTVTATKRVTVPQPAPSASSTKTADPRSEQVEEDPTPRKNPVDAVDEQFRAALDQWAQANSQRMFRGGDR